MPKESFASLPLALGSLSSWQVLLDRGVFVHWGVLGYNGQSMLSNGIYGRGLESCAQLISGGAGY